MSTASQRWTAYDDAVAADETQNQSVQAALADLTHTVEGTSYTVTETGLALTDTHGRAATSITPTQAAELAAWLVELYPTECLAAGVQPVPP